jgi:hypothetical protein
MSKPKPPNHPGKRYITAYNKYLSSVTFNHELILRVSEVNSMDF